MSQPGSQPPHENWAGGTHGTQYPPGAGQTSPGTRPVADDVDKLIVIAAHASIYLGVVIIVPTILFIIFKDRNLYVRQHTASALDMHIWTSIFGVIATIAIVSVFLIVPGAIMAVVLGAYALIAPIVAIIAAAESKPFTYPWTPRIFAN